MMMMMMLLSTSVGGACLVCWANLHKSSTRFDLVNVFLDAECVVRARCLDWVKSQLAKSKERHRELSADSRTHTHTFQETFAILFSCVSTKIRSKPVGTLKVVVFIKQLMQQQQH